MADATTIMPNEPAFTPEPVPEALADTELNGLNPEPADEPDKVEEVKDETTEEQSDKESVPTDDPDKAEEADTTSKEEAKTDEPAEEQKPVLDPKEQARVKFEERQQEKANRNYVQEQRQQIREAEQAADPTDQARRLEILEAKQYVDSVERAQMTVRNDIATAQRDIPFFKQDTPVAKAAFDQALANYANAYGVTDPETGQWLGAQDLQGNHVPLLPYLQQQATLFEQLTSATQRTSQANEAKMRSKAVTPSNPGKVTSSGDELQDLLDKVGDVPLF